ncbi:MAG: hypothetical protein IIW36_05505 [Clostridia bacterium]|nr:hypothetical protein [Clostridia bacterium]
MKKILALLLCLMMVLPLASCEMNDGEKEPSQTNPPAPPASEAEKAMQMYDAVIRNEICVFDERLGKTKLQSLRFPSNHAKLDECELLTKAILDIDQDGVNEYIIKSPDNDHIILRYHNGKVYSYCLDVGVFCRFNTDGTFYWSDPSVPESWEGGLSKIIFDGERLNTQTICSLKYSEKSVINYYETDHYEYYINGEAATYSEFQDVYRFRTSMRFTPFAPTSAYPITTQQAWNIANAHWDNLDGCSEGAVGTLVSYKVVLLGIPNSDTSAYHVALQAEFFSNHDIRHYCIPPEEIRSEGQILVDAFTGEVSEYDNIPSQPSENDIAMEMYAAALRNEITVFETDYRVFNCLMNCKTPYDRIPLSDLESLRYAYTDLDGDTVPELVIDCGDTLILRYYMGIVYAYPFPFRQMDRLKTDGSHSWNHTGQNFEYGESQIFFEDARIRSRELWRIVNDGTPDAEYFIEEKPVTLEELQTYLESRQGTEVAFAPLAFSTEGSISAEEARSIANQYWGDVDGGRDAACGTTLISRVVIVNEPNPICPYYRVAWQVERYSHWEEGWEERPPYATETYKQILVHMYTGECREYAVSEPCGAK